MLALLFALTRADYVEVTAKNQNEIIGGPKPAFVKFYSPSCGHCAAMAEPFSEAASAYTDVVFGGVDCSEQDKICQKYDVSGYPTVYLFSADKKDEKVEFEGERTVDGFCDFIENYTHIKAKRPRKLMVDLNPVIFDNVLSKKKCTFVTFYAPWCGHCKHFLPQARLAAAAFEPDTNITIGAVNCEQYKNFCDERFSVSGFPTIKLLKNPDDEPIPYSGPRTVKGIADFINENCGTERGVDGLLNDEAGIIPAATDIVQNYLSALKDSKDTAIYIAKMKEIEGADFYVKVIERINAKGLEQLAKDVDTMKGILEARKGSPKSLDGMKRRYNVFLEFLPKPQATPAPEAETVDSDEEI